MHDIITNVNSLLGQNLHVQWSILRSFISKGMKAFDIDDRCFHTVSMRWLWMNNEMSPLQPWGGTETTKTTRGTLKFFKDKQNICSEKVLQKINTAYPTLPGKWNTCFQDITKKSTWMLRFTVVIFERSNWNDNWSLNYHMGFCETERQVRNYLNKLSSPQALIKSAWWDKSHW